MAGTLSSGNFQGEEMVFEQFLVKVKAGRESEFEAAMELGLRTVMARAAGMRAWSFRRCVETPDHYQVQLEWDSIEDHLVGYRESPLASQFRAIVTPLYDGWPETKPDMKHFSEIASGGHAQ
jgi:hypothetical protein